MNSQPLPTVAELNPNAPRKFLCGIPHLHIPCDKCGDMIWTSAANNYAVCHHCNPVMKGLEAIANYHPIIPHSERIFHGTRPVGFAY